MILPGRNGSDGGQYRYGFNGYEGDPEIKGEGNSYTTEFRQYDPRVFRWLSIDPVVKVHESPYMGHSGNPIWFADPNGADSTLAAGGTVWKWTAESGDTYNEISSRTGVSVDDLRYFNQEAITDDHKIPTGALLNISDPSCSAPSTCSDIVTSDGSITIYNYDSQGVNRLGIVLEFTPDANNLGSEYVWFQTFSTNDPLGGADRSADRDVLNNTAYGNDQAAGVRAFRGQSIMQFRPSNVVVRPSSTDIGFLDGPSRSPINSGTILWDANLTLLKKVNGNWVTVTTIQYGFTLQNQIDPKALRVNPDVAPADQNFHQNAINNSTDPLLR